MPWNVHIYFDSNKTNDIFFVIDDAELQYLQEKFLNNYSRFVLKTVSESYVFFQASPDMQVHVTKYSPYHIEERLPES